MCNLFLCTLATKLCTFCVHVCSSLFADGQQQSRGVNSCTRVLLIAVMRSQLARASPFSLFCICITIKSRGRPPEFFLPFSDGSKTQRGLTTRPAVKGVWAAFWLAFPRSSGAIIIEDGGGPIWQRKQERCVVNRHAKIMPPSAQQLQDQLPLTQVFQD